MKRVKIAHFPGIALTIALISLLAYLLGWSSLLAVKTISITGTSEPALIQSSIDINTPKIFIGEPLARVDVQSLRRRVLLNEWVSSAVIDRNWLHGELTVAVHERVPVASYQASDGTTHYFEASGLDFLSPIKYPAIPNISLNDPSTSAKERVARLLTTLHDKSSALLENAQSFTVTTAGNGAVTLGMKVEISPTRTVTIRWGDGIDIPLKIAIYQKLVTLKENAKARIFDLSDPLSPITK
jgi:cell division protein FtsQ